MVNILRGDLAVVGPRPEQPQVVAELTGKIPFYGLRHLVRPGLTGWAQVKYQYASSDAETLEKLQYEFFYLPRSEPRSRPAHRVPHRAHRARAEGTMSAVADAPVADSSAFRGFLRSAGKLALARQVSGLIFVGAVLALPALAAHGTSTDFVWAYFAMMTLTSLLGFGLERLAGTVTAERGAHAGAPHRSDAHWRRYWSLGCSRCPWQKSDAAASLWAMFRFVGVTVPAEAWWATLVWIFVGLVGPLVFAALRTVGNSTAEPVGKGDI